MLRLRLFSEAYKEEAPAAAHDHRQTSSSSRARKKGEKEKNQGRSTAEQRVATAAQQAGQ